MKKFKGFTLIELMVTIAILGILVTVAFPSYQNYVRQSNRAAAKAVLHESAQFMEQFYTTNNRYDQTLSSTAVALPAELGQAPKTGAARYNISILNATNTTFTLQAVPAAGTMMVGDACGTYTLTNTGAQNSGGSNAECWNR